MSVLDKPITVHNVHGKVDNVYGVVDEKDTGCLLSIPAGDDRFCCSECQRSIEPCPYVKTPVKRMYVDTQSMVWCESCGRSAMDKTIRSTKKNPDDGHPKVYHEGRNYYRRLKRKKETD